MSRVMVTVLLLTLPPSALAQAPTITLTPDFSGSLDREAQSTAIANLRPILREAADTIEGLEVRPFADPSGRRTGRVFTWGKLPVAAPFDINSVPLDIQQRLYRS